MTHMMCLPCPCSTDVSTTGAKSQSTSPAHETLLLRAAATVVAVAVAVATTTVVAIVEVATIGMRTGVVIDTMSVATDMTIAAAATMTAVVAIVTATATMTAVAATIASGTVIMTVVTTIAAEVMTIAAVVTTIAAAATMTVVAATATRTAATMIVVAVTTTGADMAATRAARLGTTVRVHHLVRPAKPPGAVALPPRAHATSEQSTLSVNGWRTKQLRRLVFERVPFGFADTMSVGWPITVSSRVQFVDRASVRCIVNACLNDGVMATAAPTRTTRHKRGRGGGAVGHVTALGEWGKTLSRQAHAAASAVSRHVEQRRTGGKRSRGGRGSRFRMLWPRHNGAATRAS